MSQISGFGAVESALAGPTNQFSEMSTEDFVRIIFTELSNQDPFQPNDSAALLEQLNSIRSIESDINLTERLEALVFENQFASAASMIGRVVTGLTADLEQVSGTVVSIQRRGDAVMLELEAGHLVPVENIQSIVAPEPPA
jgi:flagellar basal-body rod modification protein FlgD